MDMGMVDLNCVGGTPDHDLTLPGHSQTVSK